MVDQVLIDINEPELRGQASSVFSIGDSFGASFGLLLGSLFIIQNSYHVAFQILSFGYFVAGIFWMFAVFSIQHDEDDLRKKINKRIQKS